MRRVNRAQPSRRRRGGLLIQVILGGLLLMGILAGAYSYYGKGDLDRELMALQTRFNLIVWEIKRSYGDAGPYAGLTMGSYDETRDQWSGGVAGASQLDPGVFVGTEAVPAAAGAGYCINIFGYSEQLCRVAARRLSLPGGFTHHPMSCGDENPRMRACYRATGS